MGAAECAVWVNGEIFPVPEAVVTYDEANPLAPWTMHTKAIVDLRFEPGALHAETHDFGVVASRLVGRGGLQGTIRLPGRDALILDRVLGVVEDQSVVW